MVLDTTPRLDYLPEMEMRADGIKGLTPAQMWDADSAKHSLDELFNNARRYQSGGSYRVFMEFVSRFRFYSPYNAMLLHIQMPGAQFVAPATRWLSLYDRDIKASARPLVILQPMGPVMFVFDVSDTEPRPKARPLPKAVDNPFEGLSGHVGPAYYERTIENAKRDGVKITTCKEGSQSAGSIMVQDSKTSEKIPFLIAKNKTGEDIFTLLLVRYHLLVNEKISREARYATIVHELAHLYCGHIGTPNVKWWPDRIGLANNVSEFEAESVAYLICKRLGIQIPSDLYLSGYLSKNDQDIPPISLERVLKAAGLIETMGLNRMKLRKEK